MYDINKIRQDFPILGREVYGSRWYTWTTAQRHRSRSVCSMRCEMNIST